MGSKADLWVQAEMLVAELEGGEIQPGSGNSYHQDRKGDVKSKTALIEVKSTSKGSFSLPRSVVASIITRAERIDREPRIAVVFCSAGSMTVHRASAYDLEPLFQKKSLRVKPGEKDGVWEIT